MSNKNKAIKPNYYSKELLSALNVIQENNELEKKQMEYEQKQQIPELTQKISIMDALNNNQQSLKNKQDCQYPINDKYNIEDSNANENEADAINDNIDSYYDNGDNEPMTFNPSKHSRSQDLYPTEKSNINNHNFNSSFSQASSSKGFGVGMTNSNQFISIIEELKEKIKSEYHQIDQFSKHIEKSLTYDINNSSKKDILDSIIDFTNQTHSTFQSIFSENAKKLDLMKESFHDPQLKELENSIFQVTNFIGNSNEGNINYSNRSKTQLMNSSAMKSKELNTSSSQSIPIVTQINEIDKIASIYKSKMVFYQDQISTLNSHVKYYQELLFQSKGLIDELYEKNKMLSMKLIKYKDISELHHNSNNNNNINNSSYSKY